jgi:NAD(P)-dependent dehydrogenase (short-subunit alcohol dehydrogenase family)
MCDGKHFAVATGGSTGIGAEICRQMLEAGYEVISLARRKPAQSHARLHAVEVDLVDRSANRVGRRRYRRPLSNFTHRAQRGSDSASAVARRCGDLQALMQLHLGAALTLMQTALPAMKRNRFGRVVFMSSRGALGLETRSAYSATKAGMIGMARTWALELARETALAAAIPVKRLGRSADVARAVMVLLRPG